MKVKLTIIGQGPLDDRLKEIVSHFESKKVIEFIGWVEKDTMDSYYENASVFLFPSHEGAGMVVVEALSHGLPIICFDNYGPGELILDNAGVKIPYTTYDQSIVSFSNSLKSFYEDKVLYETVKKNF